MSKSGIVIAIDGPAGAGKSSVAKILARDLGLSYLDTGAMYRALALKVTRLGLGPADGDEAAVIGGSTKLDFEAGDPQRVMMDSLDVTEAIRTPEIGQLASELSAHPGVRRVLVERQKSIVAGGGVVLEGRDVTTVVAPDATVKIYLTASLEERATRRRKEFEARGIATAFDRVRSDMEMRDHRDITRSDSPLAVSDGAHIIDSANMSILAVVEEIKRLVAGNLVDLP